MIRITETVPGRWTVAREAASHYTIVMSGLTREGADHVAAQAANLDPDHLTEGIRHIRRTLPVRFDALAIQKGIF